MRNSLVGSRPTRCAARSKLPEEQRELIQLAFYKGWSHSEIARETELPLGTVKSGCDWQYRACATSLKNASELRANRFIYFSSHCLCIAYDTDRFFMTPLARAGMGEEK